ncbi:sulfate/molybdate ABC transporter ATP-binding protein [Paenarthrobacter sp. NPDC089714]|uniref:sulfate/molybdate ABC transporter ATP-binding protein n=1 Tax=unclassified Paenarthrobacter TaxID=2634190 RepID=UPI00381365F1
MTFTLNVALKARNFDVSLNIGPAETVAVLGPNGAGKSTLLGITAGLLRPDTGYAEIGARTLFDIDGGTFTPPHARGTALLAQESLLFPHLTVVDNVAFGPRAAGASRKEAHQIAQHWLGEVDAVEFAARRPGQLSGGQAQRVAVARALATNPELLLLDEPMAALDIHAAPLLRRLLKRVLADRKAIIITHDILDALMLADRVVVLEDGHIIEQGPTREILERPRSRFAAGLSGLNLLTGTITESGLATDDGLEIAGQREDAAFPGNPGAAAFPPSAVSIYATAGHGSPRNSFKVTITDLEPHGDLIRVRAGHLAADVTPAASAELGLAPGSEAYFVIKATAITVYAA